MIIVFEKNKGRSKTEAMLSPEGRHQCGSLSLALSECWFQPEMMRNAWLPKDGPAVLSLVCYDTRMQKKGTGSVVSNCERTRELLEQETLRCRKPLESTMCEIREDPMRFRKGQQSSRSPLYISHVRMLHHSTVEERATASLICQVNCFGMGESC